MKIERFTFSSMQVKNNQKKTNKRAAEMIENL